MNDIDGRIEKLSEKIDSLRSEIEQLAEQYNSLMLSSIGLIDTVNGLLEVAGPHIDPVMRTIESVTHNPLKLLTGGSKNPFARK